MELYKSKKTLHLYRPCRKTRGIPVELDVFLHRIENGEPLLSGNAEACARFKEDVCGICLRRWARLERAKDMQELKKRGLTLQAIGDQYGVSRQCVFQLLEEVR